jgi:hypothetical protein
MRDRLAAAGVLERAARRPSAVSVLRSKVLTIAAMVAAVGGTLASKLRSRMRRAQLGLEPEDMNAR